MINPFRGFAVVPYIFQLQGRTRSVAVNPHIDGQNSATGIRSQVALKAECNLIGDTRTSHVVIAGEVLNAVYGRILLKSFTEGSFHNEEDRTVYITLTDSVHISINGRMGNGYIKQTHHRLKFITSAFDGIYWPTGANGNRD